ncbi:MAG: M20/M25/M40 family metallo-hydrolase [Trebonia sp.]
MTATADVIELLDQLVRIESVNPRLDPTGAGETEIAAFLTAWGDDAGLRVDTIEQTPGRPSVVLRGGRAIGGRRLLLCGHLDTVGLAGNRDALTPLLDGDRLYARGAYDMKAGLAAALIACAPTPPAPASTAKSSSLPSATKSTPASASSKSSPNSTRPASTPP